MNNRKLTPSSLEHGPVSERFARAQRIAGLEIHSPSRERADEALKAVVAHVVERKGLQHGMQAQHVDMALNFLDTDYPERHALNPKERQVVEDVLKKHFGIKDEKPEIEEETA